jgi:TrmH family RNA methyltransferase
VLKPAERERLCVVLVRTRNPLNIGSIARVMSNFGIFDLRLVQPFEPSFREARSAVGAAQLLQEAKVFETIGEAVADCALVIGTSAIRGRELHQRVEVLPRGAALVRAALKRQRAALVFGSEKTGLSSQDLSHCNLLLRIPTREEHVSLNLAQAVAITLYEISRSVGKAPALAAKRATSGELDQLSMTLLEALRESGYIKGDSAEAIKLKIRRMFKRLALEEGDVELWLGMLRKMHWKMKRK